MSSGSQAPQWAAAVTAALAVHFLLLAGYAGLDRQGAAGEGRGGIEIGLGMLGNMGESLVDADARETLGQTPEAPPAEALAEMAPETAQPDQPEPQPPAVVTEQVRQITEVTVQAMKDERTALPAPVEPAPGSAPESVPEVNAPSEGGGIAPSAQRRQSSGIGSSDSAGGSAAHRASYVAQLAARLNRYKHYPMAARRARQEGTVTLFLAIRRDGSIAASRIDESSGWKALDAAALRMLERAQPLPPVPASIKAGELRVKLPVSFSLSPL